MELLELNDMGILGHNGEYKPRFGLWIDDSRECRHAINGLIADGYDCDVVLKYGARCSAHCHESHRPVLPLSVFVQMADAEMLEDRQGCYIREVFFPERVNLRKRVA